jgi:glycosyltransferase involved in cell wall biosynthesis
VVSVSASTKIHAFALAEQLERNHSLDNLLTTYAYSKNKIARKFVKRVDKEQIPVKKIRTLILLAIPIKLFPRFSHIWNNLFDRWVASRLSSINSKVFIGWSGMSLHSIRKAKKRGMITIVERGSSHILVQDRILKEEYLRFGKNFNIHPVVIKKELLEYTEADYISVPSNFVRDSFIMQGIKEEKLLVNPYGAGKYFSPINEADPETYKKFRIVYLGTLSIQKGLIYLFQALQQLAIPENLFEVWFIGNIDKEFRPTVDKYNKPNWTFFGHINHYDIQSFLVKCDVGIQPSLQEGLSMVIPQMMSCGLPVIVTPNTGGEDIVKDGLSGFVVPIRDSTAITNRITELFNDNQKLVSMKENAVKAIRSGYTWEDYGHRYKNNIDLILNKNSALSS